MEDVEKLGPFIPKGHYAKWNKLVIEKKYCMITLIWRVKNRQGYKSEEKNTGLVEGKMETFSWSIKFSCSRWTNSRDLRSPWL